MGDSLMGPEKARAAKAAADSDSGLLFERPPYSTPTAQPVNPQHDVSTLDQIQTPLHFLGCGGGSLMTFVSCKEDFDALNSKSADRIADLLNELHSLDRGIGHVLWRFEAVKEAELRDRAWRSAAFLETRRCFHTWLREVMMHYALRIIAIRTRAALRVRRTRLAMDVWIGTLSAEGRRAALVRRGIMHFTKGRLQAAFGELVQLVTEKTFVEQLSVAGRTDMILVQLSRGWLRWMAEVVTQVGRANARRAAIASATHTAIARAWRAWLRGACIRLRVVRWRDGTADPLARAWATWRRRHDAFAKAELVDDIVERMTRRATREELARCHGVMRALRGAYITWCAAAAEAARTHLTLTHVAATFLSSEKSRAWRTWKAQTAPRESGVRGTGAAPPASPGWASG